MQIATIAIENLDQYIIAGFLQFDPETGKSIDPNAETDEIADLVDDTKPTREEAIVYLDAHNISWVKNTGDAKLIQKALDNGWSAQPASKEINDDGLDALRDDAEDATDASVDTETADDLGDLANLSDDDTEDTEDTTV